MQAAASRFQECCLQKEFFVIILFGVTPLSHPQVSRFGAGQLVKIILNRYSSLIIAGRLAEGIAILAFVIHAWQRIKPSMLVMH